MTVTARQRSRKSTRPTPIRPLIPGTAPHAARVFELLRAAHPDAHCELDHRSPFELLVAVVLSAQTTDVAVNRITPGLFHRYPDAAHLARADPAEVERAINTIGMFRQKARSIVALARELVEKHGGQVPDRLAELVALPGVGRKTANVVLGVAFGRAEGVVVDTHVLRVSQRLGLSRHQQPERVEQDLMRLYPQNDWIILGHTLVFQGRRVCLARRPRCSACAVRELCPSAATLQVAGPAPAGSGAVRIQAGSSSARSRRSRSSGRTRDASKPTGKGKSRGARPTRPRTRTARS